MIGHQWSKGLLRSQSPSSSMTGPGFLPLTATKGEAWREEDVTWVILSRSTETGQEVQWQSVRPIPKYTGYASQIN